MKNVQSDFKISNYQNGDKVKADFTIKPFSHGDSEQVARLFQTYFPWQQEVDIEFLSNKLSAELSGSAEIPSLVCAAQDGSIHGYISVKTIDFLYKGKVVKAAVCSNFMVTEAARTAMIPMRMLRRLLSGPQDFSLSDDATNISRLLWCKLGGEIAYPYSNYYSLPLRPFTFFLYLTSRNKAPWLRPLVNTLGPAIDKLYDATRYKRDDTSISTYQSIELTATALEEGFKKLMGNYQLFPYMNEHYLEEHLSALKEETQFGKLEARAVVSNTKKVIGWYIYYIGLDKRCRVVHSESLPGMEDVLFHNLKTNASEKGCIDISGRTSPSQIGTGFTEKSFNRPGKKWVLIHSKNQELISTIQSGKAFLSSIW